LEKPERKIPFRGGGRRGRRTTTVAAARGMVGGGRGVMVRKEGVGGVAHL